MEPLVHLLKANLVFLLLWAAHRQLLRGRMLDHRWERAWWLLVPVLAFVLPLLRMPATDALQVVLPMPAFMVGEQAPPSAVAMAPVRMPWAVRVYLLGMTVALLWLVVRYVHAWRWMDGGNGTFSLFHRVVVPSGVQGEDRIAMEAHERAHVRAGHSFDVLYYELLRVLSWWNPAWTDARRSLQHAHEWAADAEAARHHSDYPRLLVARALGVPSSSLVNAFASTHIKTRILMLQVGQPPKRPGLRYLLFLPVLAFAALLACNRPDTPAAPAAKETVQIADLDELPEFPGGSEAMDAFLKTQLPLPEELLPADSPHAKVYAQFTVDTDGIITDVKVRRGLRADLDHRVVEAIQRMPAWKPGRKDGRAVAVSFTMPVNYAAAIAK